MKRISRICDMKGGFKLNLFVEDDGDICVSVIPEGDKFSFDSVEFCASGTQSPKTQRALHELYKAMIADEKERPQH